MDCTKWYQEAREDIELRKKASMEKTRELEVANAELISLRAQVDSLQEQAASTDAKLLLRQRLETQPRRIRDQGDFDLQDAEPNTLPSFVTSLRAVIERCDRRIQTLQLELAAATSASTVALSPKL